ncbi:MAG: hypothetical protein WBI63_09985 [Coriobacteriia bacterium]
MRTSFKQSYPPKPAVEEPPVVYDDGGCGLFDACSARFTAPDFFVECDARHTVWVKRTDGSRSYGVSPWLLRRHSMDEILETVEEKLGVVVRH